MAVGYRHNRDRQTLHYIFFQHHRCFCWQHRRNPAAPARVVGGVSALRCGNPICNYELSKSLTVNIFTLAVVVYCGRQNDPKHDEGT